MGAKVLMLLSKTLPRLYRDADGDDVFVHVASR